MHVELNVTPAPINSPGWREVGSHWIAYPELHICYCGPANHITGPQWADGVDPRTQTKP